MITNRVITFIFSLPYQCLVNVLKSLVDWEKSRLHSEKQSLSIHSSEEEPSGNEHLEIKSREDVTGNFEKAKAHKSTVEAVISEVINI